MRVIKYVKHFDFARLGYIVALVCGAGLGLNANAARVTLSSFPPNPGVMPGGGWQFTSGSTFANPTSPRAWVNGVYGGVPGVRAMDMVTVAGRAGPLVVQTMQAMTIAEGALAIGRCLATSVVCAGVATAAALAYATYRIRDDQAGGLEHDPGAPPGMKSVISCGTPPAVGKSTVSVEIACTPYKNYIKSSRPSPWYFRETFFTCDERGCTLGGYWMPDNNYSVVGMQATYNQELACSNTVRGERDFRDNLGRDGKCPAGVVAPISMDDAVAKVVELPPTLPSESFGNAVKYAVDQQGISVPAELTVSGPASQTGTPVQTTTSNATGTVTETVTPNYQYQYADNKVTYITTNTTTINNNGDVTTVVADQPVSTPQDPLDPCTSNPGRVGCIEVGSAPSVDMPKLNRNLSFAAETPNLPVGCPGPVTVAAHGTSYAFSYEPTCQAAIAAKPWVVAGGSLAALFMVLAALRSI